MKKNVLYCFKLSIGKLGDIANAECECAAGKGPYGACKHSAAVAVMIVEFCSTGNLKIKRSCTEGLQTFHHPRTKHEGEVLTVEELFPSPISGSLKPELDDAPSFDDIVRNKVTQEKAEEIRHSTRKQRESTKWYKEREWRMTASQFGDIISATDRRDYTKLCESILSGHDFHSEAVCHGLVYEQEALQLFAQKSGLQVDRCGFFVHPTFYYLGASPDALVGRDGIAEVKCPFNGRNCVVQPSKMSSFLEIRNGQIHLKINHKYYYQVQGQLALSKRNFCYFVVFTFVDSFVEKFFLDTNYFENHMKKELEQFYEIH